MLRTPPCTLLVNLILCNFYAASIFLSQSFSSHTLFQQYLNTAKTAYLQRTTPNHLLLPWLRTLYIFIILDKHDLFSIFLFSIFYIDFLLIFKNLPYLIIDNYLWFRVKVNLLVLTLGVHSTEKMHLFRP